MVGYLTGVSCRSSFLFRVLGLKYLRVHYNIKMYFICMTHVSYSFAYLRNKLTISSLLKYVGGEAAGGVASLLTTLLSVSDASNLRQKKKGKN